MHFRKWLHSYAEKAGYVIILKKNVFLTEIALKFPKNYIKTIKEYNYVADTTRLFFYEGDSTIEYKLNDFEPFDKLSLMLYNKNVPMLGILIETDDFRASNLSIEGSGSVLVSEFPLNKVEKLSLKGSTTIDREFEIFDSGLGQFFRFNMEQILDTFEVKSKNNKRFES